MAKTNFKYEKRQRELEKKKKADEKAEKRAGKKLRKSAAPTPAIEAMALV